jgi:phytoene synthase
MQMEHAWEHGLLDRAHEALHRHEERPAHAANFDTCALASAYAYCDSLTAVNSRSFHLASSLLPPGQRAAVRALYAFCRVSDDIVDRDVDRAGDHAGDRNPLGIAATPDLLGGSRSLALEEWRRLATANHPPSDQPVALAWAHARQRYQVPDRYAEQLIDGVARDLEQTRYQTFAELASYCYGVASTVGLMSMHIIGFAGREAIPYAIKLGVALQMTNILRDIGEDWRAGRVYLPQDELAEFGLGEGDLAAGVVTPQWREFMRFQIERNRRLYAESMPGIGLLHRDGRFAISAAAELYCGILDAIERADYDVFTHRAFVGKWGKLRMLPGIWWRSGRHQVPAGSH